MDEEVQVEGDVRRVEIDRRHRHWRSGEIAQRVRGVGHVVPDPLPRGVDGPARRRHRIARRDDRGRQCPQAVERVGALLKKESLKADADAQALEDVVALVFLESYLAGFVAAHGEYDAAKFADILAKTAKKMSPRGRAAAVTLIALPPEVAPTVRNAMDTPAA